jgi:hypothetical protein
MDCSAEQSILFMQLAFKVVLLSNHRAFCVTVASTFALAVFAIVFTVALFAITIAIAAALALSAVQQLPCPGNNAITIGGDNIDDTGNGSQSQNDLGNHLKSFHSKPSRFFMVSITSITNPVGKCNIYFLNYT